MSMDFSEFLRRLGAEPGNQDPEVLEARRSGDEFEQAAEAAEQFESRLTRALQLPVPDDLLNRLESISDENPATDERPRRWRHLAMAAAVLIAVGAAGVTWNLNHSWESVDDYVVDHYNHDGNTLLEKAGGASADEVQKIFARFGMTATAELASDIRFIKYCPTPNGKGVHMVLNTDAGLITVIYMPETVVDDQQGVEFDGMDALFVSLRKGSAVIVGKPQQAVGSFHALVQQSIIPVDNEA